MPISALGRSRTVDCGFTLVELLVVVVIIGLMSVVVGLSIERLSRDRLDQDQQAVMRQINQAQALALREQRTIWWEADQTGHRIVDMARDMEPWQAGAVRVSTDLPGSTDLNGLLRVPLFPDWVPGAGRIELQHGTELRVIERSSVGELTVGPLR
jgi:type II secretion system protein H